MKSVMTALVVSIGALAAWAQAPASWGADVPTFNINNTKLGTMKDVVTNENTQYKLVKSPEAPLDVLSYRILVLQEEKLKIGQIRPGEVINVTKHLYFNSTGQLVAIEMEITNLDIDKRSFILDSLGKKYDSLPDDRRDFWRFKITDNIVVESTSTQTTPQREVNGRVMSPIFTIRNLYYVKGPYRTALDESQKTVQLYNLL